ncbi:unnamed protein product [Lactuca virosa]|uniref:CBF1-interacting co-repressor CIR N-terminal domain-containing protein n=1 Tax=Lactuca virosa TaxID=75947 RepID=A0AAU9LMW4_9ASTR|nr:unnamed protein product [Lactuca virosa]
MRLLLFTNNLLGSASDFFFLRLRFFSASPAWEDTERDTDFRVEQLRQARGLASVSASASSHQSTAADPAPTPTPEAEPKSKHINLFEGIRIFDPVDVDKRKIELGDEKRKGGFKRMKKEPEPPKVVLPEDEKYRLGYGVAGKGVKLPWYLEKRPNGDDDDVDNNDSEETVVTNSSKKKSVEELREERLKREAREKERERALMQKHKHKNGRGGYYSTR